MHAAAIAFCALASLPAAPSRAGEYLPDQLQLRPLRLAPIERNVNEVSNAASRQVAATLDAAEVAIPRSWRLVGTMPVAGARGGQAFMLVFQDTQSSAVHALSVTPDGFVSGGQGFTIPAR
ncbi:MAG: hypothetical protein FJX21_20730 [Alphaproteobacteria bacterium]|nr:hypothetical protein [Alphaproteobacteria bacterium]